MTRESRAPRTKGDLLAELKIQTALLEHACQAFDRGLQPIAKHSALSLRVLLHHHGQSRALLEQLGLRDKHFFDTAEDLNPKNLLTENPLCIMQLGGGSRYKPLLSDGPPTRPRWITFPEWWSKNVIRDNKRRVMTRRDLVLNVADTDGGGHVDPELDQAYMDLSRNNSLGWLLHEGDVVQPFPPPVMACVRQIAHEVLVTLRTKAPQESGVTYAI